MSPRPISELVHAHVGRPGVVLGGGMSLPAQYARIEHLNAVHVAANQHASVMGYRVDYIVAVDADMPAKVRDYGKPIIAPRRKGADFMIFRNGFNSSGVTAAWVLWLMGCVPIIVSPGIDCFVGGTYCHDPKAKSSGTGSSVEQHLMKWQRLKQECPAGAFRSLGGPTQKVFPTYSPDENRIAIATREEIMHQALGKVIEVREPRDFLAGYKVGDRVEVKADEARHACGSKWAVRVGAPC